MDKLILALAPAFAAGFAIQHLLEVLDPVLFTHIKPAKHKKMVLGLISLILGLGLACGGLRVLQPLGFTGSEIYDLLVTGLVISSGTDGVNSLVKFLGYTKENKKTKNGTTTNELPRAERPPRREMTVESKLAAR